MNLRPYQQEAVSSAIEYLRRGHNPVLQLATGTGKSVIISALSEHYRHSGREVWALTHVQQLVGQNATTYRRYSGIEPAIVCSGLGRKDIHGGVTFGTIQSVINVLPQLKAPDLIIIDEAHRVPHNEGEPSLYESILRRYSSSQRVAMTATPWRMDNGIIYGDGSQFWFDRLAYNYTVPRAVEDGWLCPLVGVEADIQLDVEDVAVQGDFLQPEVENLQTENWLNAVAKSLVKLCSQRRHIAVYCPTVAAAEKTSRIIQQTTGWNVETLYAGMDQRQRDLLFSRFFSGEVRVLCSVDMITTGFDFPALDCIVCLRPTLSSSLWVQIQGRGTRLHPDKKNCLVLDYVGNLLRLGGVDMYDTYYREKNLENVAAVPLKPYVRKERKLHPGARTLTPIDPMTGKEAGEGSKLVVKVHAVNSVAIATRRNPQSPILLVQYACTTAENARIDASMFVNTETPNRDTLDFFERRSLAVKLPCAAASLSWQMKGARLPRAVTVRKSGRYWNVVEEHFGETE